MSSLARVYFTCGRLAVLTQRKHEFECGNSGILVVALVARAATMQRDYKSWQVYRSLLVTIASACLRCSSSMESAQFWDGLHSAHKEANDWYLHANDCYSLLEPLLPVKKGTKCLHVGCGTSNLGDLLGCTCEVLNVDFSVECIEYHRVRDPAGTYAVMDVTDMQELGDASFDLIVDKGTMDSLQRDAQRPHAGSLRALAEMLRVVGPNGAILMVSMIPPRYREPCLLTCLHELRSTWTLEVHTWDVVPFEEPSQTNVWLYVIHPSDKLSLA